MVHALITYLGLYLTFTICAQRPIFSYPVTFCIIPVTVAEAERSFSKLKLIKNFLRTSMTQGRLSDLGILAIESELSRTQNLDNIINIFYRHLI